MSGTIYKIYCTANDKTYIGSTTQPVKNRWSSHRSMLNRNIHDNIHLQRSWNKYGEDLFVFKVVQECSVDELISTEKYWIDNTDNLFNINLNPQKSPMFGRNHTKQSRDKITLGRMKYSMEQVKVLKSIILNSSFTSKEIFDKFRISRTMVNAVRRGVAWSHI